MNILAIDQSTPHASIALVSEHELVASDTWTESRSRGQQLFERLPALLAGCGVGFTDVDLFAVGLGPGIFSGLRISLAAFRSFAQPDNTPVVGVSSGEALAVAAHTATDATPVAVAGDARRSRFWAAVFDVDAGLPRVVKDYALHGPGDLSDALSGARVVVSPEWTRIGEQLRAAAPADARLIAEDRAPGATEVAIIASRRAEAGIEPGGSSLRPIYLHPPVFVPPRFPQRGPQG